MAPCVTSSIVDDSDCGEDGLRQTLLDYDVLGSVVVIINGRLAYHMVMSLLC